MKKALNLFKNSVNKILGLPRRILENTAWVWPKYRVAGTLTLNGRDLLEYKKPWALRDSLESYCKILEGIILEKLHSKEAFSIVRLNDGEAYFMQEDFRGNIGKRHITDWSNYRPHKWEESFNMVDMYAFHTSREMRKLWVPVLGSNVLKNFFPMQAIYALVASKRLFWLAEGSRLGFIGAENKINLISRLMSQSTYRKYLQCSSKCTYHAIPEVGACNDPEALVNALAKEIISDPADIYLVGMGIAKLYVLPWLSEKTGKIFIDIGHGLDAIAGIVPKDRQFFGGWVNYQLEEGRYDSVDFLSQKKSSSKLRSLGAEMRPKLLTEKSSKIY